MQATSHGMMSSAELACYTAGQGCEQNVSAWQDVDQGLLTAQPWPAPPVVWQLCAEASGFVPPQVGVHHSALTQFSVQFLHVMHLSRGEDRLAPSSPSSSLPARAEAVSQLVRSLEAAPRSR
mmetsp:Transcript_102092/g.264381  ORF Transcript_102092/g.264381 Transcript_102092/m.264381 type:complete len:122 (+) Transcript_102092:163-528(+)